MGEQIPRPLYSLHSKTNPLHQIGNQLILLETSRADLKETQPAG